MSVYQEKWRVGSTRSTVVSDTPVRNGKDTGHNDFDEYGGHLVAENVPSTVKALLIAAAPDLFNACQIASGLLRVIAGNAVTGVNIKLIDDALSKVDQAIHKAEGGYF